MDQEAKACTVCGCTKPLTDFSKDNRNSSGYSARCKKCAYEKTRIWVAKNKERVSSYHREYRARHPEIGARVRNWGLLKRHGITNDEYLKMLSDQKGVCKICGGPANSKDGFFHIDHDHATGKIRGLLCHFCNTGIGSLRDSADIMKSAIKYLEENK